MNFERSGQFPEKEATETPTIIFGSCLPPENMGAKKGGRLCPHVAQSQSPRPHSGSRAPRTHLGRPAPPPSLAQCSSRTSPKGLPAPRDSESPCGLPQSRGL